MTAEEKFELLTTANVKKTICKMAVPTIISMLITSLYNLADSYFVSSLGFEAIGAVGVIFSMMAIIQACGFFFGHGSGNYISRKLGNQEYGDASNMAATGYYSAMIFGVLLTIFGLIFIVPLAKMLGSNDDILPYAKTYLMYILIGAPFMCSSLVMNNQLRFQGNATYAMIGMGSGALLNILGDFILVPLIKMHGAGLSTLLSQIISFILLRIGIIKSSNVKISIKNFKLSGLLYKNILNGGLPSLIRQSIGSVATICLNHICKIYGTDVIAAMSVVTRITNLPFSIIIGFGQGFQPVCGYNYGAKKYDRVKDGYYFTTIISFIIMIVLSVFIVWLSPNLINLFCSKNAEIENYDYFLNVGVKTLRLHCLTLPLIGLYSPANMMMQTIGKSIRASILSMARQGIFFIPLIFILSSSITGIQIVQPISDVLTLIISVVLTISVIKELKIPQVEKAPINLN